MAQFILLNKKDSVAQITLNRPDIHNALNEGMVKELRDAFLKLASDHEIRVVVLQGAGKSFCAGADLQYMQQVQGFSMQQHEASGRLLFEMLLAIYQCPKPVIARVHGAAMGGGLGLMAASDYCLASEGIVFAFSEVRLGLIPAVISPFVLRKLGLKNTKSLFFTGEKFEVQHALKIGFVDQVVATDQLDTAIDQKIEDLKLASPQAIARCKHLLHEISSASLTEAMGPTIRAIAQARVSEEGQEGMKAFLEKRKPNWAKE